MHLYPSQTDASRLFSSTMSASSRKSALQYLKAVANTVKPDFFSTEHYTGVLSGEFDNVKLTVTKQFCPQAIPANITYKIDLGSLMPKSSDSEASGEPAKALVVYVLYPNGFDGAANKLAYKGCLDDLIANEDSYTSRRIA